MRFCALEDTYSWGSEEFKLADLGYRDSLVREGWLAGNTISEVMDLYMDRIVGDDIFNYYGRQFPFQVKAIKVDGRMPLRVHPDDEQSEQRYDFLGKEKIWYVANAKPGATLMLGFKNDSDAGQLYERCLDNTVDQILNVVAVHAGQYFHIAPGTVHAADGQMLIYEISESSPLDFCLCGWGKEVSTDEFDPSLSIVDALDFINYKRFCSEHQDRPSELKMVEHLLELPQFAVNRISLSNPLKVHSAKLDSAVGYLCLQGEAMVGGTKLSACDFVLVPADIQDIELDPVAADTLLLEIIPGNNKVADPYIDPSVPSELDEPQDDDPQDHSRKWKL